MESFKFSNSSKKILLQIARKTLEAYLQHFKTPKFTNIDNDELLIEAGAFVTLTKNKNLKGCIGRFTSDVPLFELIQEMAIAAATRDSRFKSVDFNELDDLEIEISVLSPLKKISDMSEIEIGKHGIYIQKGIRTGTLLPQVASSNNWNVEYFLGYCSEHKAGIGREGWRQADVFTYEALVFEEHEFIK
ncbi:MAG: AmmeMemoRadiSam system protein A [Bacteroidales bacterium]|nr:AmmeMemoRadiSam system protein A [Bacteroidales bacterium]